MSLPAPPLPVPPVGVKLANGSAGAASALFLVLLDRATAFREGSAWIVFTLPVAGLVIGGVYERPDFLRIIADLPRTHERMPILRELGHMVPSGCIFWKNANAVAADGHPWAADPANLQLMVTV